MDRLEWDQSMEETVSRGSLCNYYISKKFARYCLWIKPHGGLSGHETFSSMESSACKQHAELIEANHLIDTMTEALRKLQRVTAIDQSFNGPDDEEVG